MNRLWLPLAAIAMISAGCSSERSIIGNWNTSVRIMNQGADSLISFQKDGTFSSKTTLPNSELPVAFTAEGTYTFEGTEKLNVNISKTALTGVPENIANAYRSRITRTFGRSNKFTVQWISSDKITLTPASGQGMQLVRAK